MLRWPSPFRQSALASQCVPRYARTELLRIARHQKTPMSHEPEQSGWHTEEAEIPLLQAMPFSRPHVLQQIRGPGSPAILELSGESLVLGRSPETDIHIPSPSLSRTHMRLERYQGTYRVIDLDSSNGVYLNEIRVHSAVLRDGDTLQLGNAVFIYHAGK